jgi:hypothetical protein
MDWILSMLSVITSRSSLLSCIIFSNGRALRHGVLLLIRHVDEEIESGAVRISFNDRQVLLLMQDQEFANSYTELIPKTTLYSAFQSFDAAETRHVDVEQDEVRAGDVAMESVAMEEIDRFYAIPDEVQFVPASKIFRRRGYERCRRRLTPRASRNVHRTFLPSDMIRGSAIAFLRVFPRLCACP